MRWRDIATHQPTLAAAATEKLIKPGVLLSGTTRRDGTARISGVEPLIMDGELWLSMMSSSAKAHDLRRDPRILLHSIVTGPERVRAGCAGAVRRRGRVRNRLAAGGGEVHAVCRRYRRRQLHRL